jgi:predicted NBD/HSP70 family sugar kinase
MISMSSWWAAMARWVVLSSALFGAEPSGTNISEVFKLAPKAGIDIDPGLGLAEQLKVVQKHLEDGHKGARQIWEAIGIYLGYTLAHYSDFYEMKHVLILGRVTSGIGGEIILAKAKEVLTKEFPALANISVTLPDEKARRVGQAVAAASLPATKQ